MNILPIEIAQHLYRQWSCQMGLSNLKDQVYTKCLEGRSVIEFKDGNKYSGQIKQGLLNGKGVFRWADGLLYEGEFNNNFLQGQGKLTWPDGSSYEGDLSKNMKHGIGKYFCAQDGSSYTGQWSHGQRTGVGKVEFANGSMFSGQFLKGQKQGSGRMTYPNGNYYDGHWEGNLKSGQGSMVWQTSGQKYTGSWVDNKQNGIGTHVWFDNKTEFKIFRNRYNGDWKDCRRQGFGTFYYSNGTKYDGYWQNNARNGFGTLTQEDGTVTMGLYKDDRLLRSQDMNSSVVSESLNFSLDVSIINQSVQLNPSEARKLKPLKVGHRKPLENREFGLSTIVHKLEVTDIFHKSHVAQNVYPHYIDLEGLKTSECFLNYLLRQHSTTKQYYKMLTTSANEHYSGMSLEHFTKFIRDLRISDQRCCPSMIYRLFSKGVKSHLSLNSDTERLVSFLQKHPQIQGDQGLGELGLAYHSQQLYDCETDPVTTLGVQNAPFSLQNVSLVPDRDIHGSTSVVLFRHFVNLLVITATLKYPDEDIEKSIVKLFDILGGNRIFKQRQSNNVSMNIASSNGLSLESGSFRSGVSNSKVTCEWTVLHNCRLFRELTSSQPSLLGTIDKTVTVRTLLKVLQKSSVIKEPLQKLVFLQKVEKYMDRAHYYFKKEYKSKAEFIVSRLETSEVLGPILNYELTQGQFCDLFEMTMLKRISTTIKDGDELKLKYANVVDVIVLTLGRGKDNRPSGFQTKVSPSLKDSIRSRRLREEQENIVRMAQQKQKILDTLQEERETRSMATNDFNVPSSAYLQEDDQDDFD